MNESSVLGASDSHRLTPTLPHRYADMDSYRDVDSLPVTRATHSHPLPDSGSFNESGSVAGSTEGGI